MLEVAMQTTIKTLLKKGYSQTYIAKTLHVKPKTNQKNNSERRKGGRKNRKKPHPSMLGSNTVSLLRFC
jgi:hypothetical protein